MDKLAFDIQVGNFALGNGFFASAKVAAGYKILDPLTLGLGLKGEYGVQNQVGQNSDFSNYGLYGYARYRLGDQFYLKGEYNYFNSQCIAGLCSDNIDREKAWFPMLGGGYFSGFGKWKFGAEVLIALGGNSDPGGFQADDIYTILEYTFTFLYNL